jgi:drug/metabolite transporter (DMT)-like permease
MLLGALAFAVMAFLTADLRDDFDWQWIAIARSGLAMVFAALLVVAGGARFVLWKPRILWMRSLAGSISLVCGFYAMTHYDVSVVLTLTNMYPLWVAVLSWPLLGHVPSSDVWGAALIGVAGVALLGMAAAADNGSPAANASHPWVGQSPAAATATVTPAVAPSDAAARLPDHGMSAAIAIGAALISSFTSAVALIGLHQLKEIDSRAIVTHFSLVSLLACLGALFLFTNEMPARNASSGALGALLGVGLFATAGQLFLTKAFSTGLPAQISVVGLSQVGFAMLLEMVFHGRTFGPLTLVGMTLIIAPTAWVLFRGKGESTARETGDTTL